MREGYIICHYGSKKYLYSVEEKKYFKAREDVVILNEESPQIKMKLKNIGEAYEWRVPEKLRQILDITYSVHSMRRHYRMDLYQTPILPETSVRRAMLIKGENQKVSLMGDDDLVSIPLALMGHDVLVLDADEYLIDLIYRANEKFGLNIKAVKVNLLEEIEVELKGKYDVIYADPVSTAEGYGVFVKRGFELLKENGIAFITVTQRYQPVLDAFINDCNLNEICRYNAFCNSYNHRIELIDDVANMVKIQKKGDEVFPDIKDNLNFFESQKETKIMWTVELFEIDEACISEQIRSFLCEMHNSLDSCIQINKYISSNNYYFIFEDNDEFKIIFTNYVDKHIEIIVTAINEMIISKIKKIILDNISYKTKREELFVCGLPVIQGRIDLEINSL